MRIAVALTLATLLTPTLAWASCPPAPDHDAALLALIEEVRAAETESDARPISRQMWELWAEAPDAASQEMLDAGMRQRESYDYAGALETFDRLVAYCPAYAEGYNQRAFVNFLSGRFDVALPDLYQALDLSPAHVAARAGLALTLMQLGRIDAARAELRMALQSNPWLSERHLLAKGAPLAEPGDDI